ncbi:MAG TPA: STT3 domain-containing protein [Thermoanaerobaculia bacterium]|nr:STT3 domain-containing protein [Thermoanaerobaculia bacterium]
MDRPRRGAFRRAALFLACALALAFVLRLVTLPALTTGGLRLLSVDDYGHLRRAAATVRDFPRVPVFDPYLNHPEGGIWIWPPLFDLAIAAPARLFFGSGAEVGQVALVAAWLPPVLGALALLPLFALARRGAGERAARLALLVYALLPGAIAWSAFGHADQHVAEALSLLGVLAAFARLLGREEPPPAARNDALLAGVALALAVLVWQGSVFLVPIVALAAFLAGRARAAAWALAAAAAVVAPFGLAVSGPVTYVSFGAFQPLFLALAAALLLLASLGRRGWIAAAALALAALAWPPIGDGVRHLVLRTTGQAMARGGYLAYPADWLRLIGEYRPLLARGPLPAITQLSAGFLLLPFALFAWGRRAWRRGTEWQTALLLAVATASILVMTLLQRRYVYDLAPLVALATADLAVAAGRRWRREATALVLALAIVPTFTALAELTRAPGAPGADLLTTLARLAALDPPPGDPLRPAATRPGAIAGVMAPWAIGHFVTLLARRPAAADNFGYGFTRQARLFTAPPEEDGMARQLLHAARCGYLVTTDLRPVLPAYAAAAGRGSPPVDGMLAVRVHESDSPRPLPFLRLVLVSQSAWPAPGGRLVPRFKVFRVE